MSPLLFSSITTLRFAPPTRGIENPGMGISTELSNVSSQSTSNASTFIPNVMDGLALHIFMSKEISAFSPANVELHVTVWSERKFSLLEQSSAVNTK